MLTIKTPERRQWRLSGVFIVNFKHILHLVLVFIVNFEQVNTGWDNVIPWQNKNVQGIYTARKHTNKI